MQSHLQAWKHDFRLGLVLGTFYGCFVIGVRTFERGWLDQPGLTIGSMAEIVGLWAVVIPLAISLLAAGIRSLLQGPPPSLVA